MARVSLDCNCFWRLRRIRGAGLFGLSFGERESRRSYLRVTMVAKHFANTFFQPSPAAVTHLLMEAGLPSSDLTAAHLEHFFACGSVDAPDGIVGVEPHGSVALLRSLAVSLECRGRGCGTALVAQAERYAQSRGAKDIYLLTTTAEPFFERLGYARVQREAAPVAIRQTHEFVTLCSSSSTLMVKRLPANPAFERDAPQAAPSSS